MIPDARPDDELAIQLLDEQLTVGRREVETGRVRVATVVNERQQLVDELLSSHSVEIERVARGEVVTMAPPIREEGDELIVPVLEETLVIERRLVLKEEVRIRRVESRERFQKTVTLRSEDIAVTREPATTDALADTNQEPLGASGPSRATGE